MRPSVGGTLAVFLMAVLLDAEAKPLVGELLRRLAADLEGLRERDRALGEEQGIAQGQLVDAVTLDFAAKLVVLGAQGVVFRNVGIDRLGRAHHGGIHLFAVVAQHPAPNGRIGELTGRNAFHVWRRR
jgi:hypothetical protein